MKIPVLLLVFSMAACSPRKPLQSTHEITGAQPERTAAVSRLLVRQGPLPGALLDAYFLEQQVGDGRLGPSDFAAFYALTVAPADIAAWRSALNPIEPQNSPPTYAAPAQAPTWWVPPDAFGPLEFFSPKSLTGRSNGWVGIDAAAGKIFIYAFTM